MCQPDPVAIAIAIADGITLTRAHRIAVARADCESITHSVTNRITNGVALANTVAVTDRESITIAIPDGITVTKPLPGPARIPVPMSVPARIPVPVWVPIPVRNAGAVSALVDGMEGGGRPPLSIMGTARTEGAGSDSVQASSLPASGETSWPR